MRNDYINSANYWTKYYTENNVDYSCDGKTVTRYHNEQDSGNAYTFINKLKEQAYYRYTAK